MLFERLLFDIGGAFEQYLSPIANIVSCPQIEADIVRYSKVAHIRGFLVHI